MVDLTGWPPSVVDHLTITQLLFYFTRHGEGREQGQGPPHARRL